MSLSILLIIFYIYLAVFFTLSFFSFYHLLKFGQNNFTAFIMTAIFMGGTVIILFIIWQNLVGIDWSQTILILPANTSTF